jgi:hypothetical protein
MTLSQSRLSGSVVRSPWLAAHIPLVLILLWGYPANAEGWSGLEPGSPSEEALGSAGAQDLAHPDMPMRPAVVESPPPDSEQGTFAPSLVPILDEGLPEGREPQRDLLTLGGIYYQRAELSGARGTEGTSLDPVLPSLVDLFLDIKPSESTFAFIRGRLLYDPLDPALVSPTGVLDQLWFKFDIAQRVFISAGRQQIKWGSSRIWNPTDFLRQPNPRPFDSFDLRTGIDMLRVNVPWESMMSNLWLITTVDLNGPDSRPVRYGGAVRAEVARGPGELALTAAFQQGRRPRYGLDWSMGVGPVDLYTELALVRDSDVKLWERTEEGFSPRAPAGPKLITSAGAAATFRTADVFMTVFRLEGFYNPLGYEDRALLTWLRSTGDYRALFFSRYYVMAQASISRRSQYQPDLTTTVVMSLGDRSGMGRLDGTVYALRDLVVQAFVQVPFGQRGSEFRFEPDPLIAELPASGLPVFHSGVSIRIRM